MKKKCLFCQNTDLSNEHIFGQWLLKELDILKKPLNMTHKNFVGMPLDVRRQSYSTLVNGRVCQKCNNGWMSELERNCKELVLNLMNLNLNEKTVADLRENNKDLAKWAFKNVILLNDSVNFRKIIPDNHYQELYKGKIPENVKVLIGFSDKEYEQELNWIQSPTVPLIITKNDYNINEILTQGSYYDVVFRLRDVFFQVVYYEVPFKNYFRNDAALSIYPEYGLATDSFETLEKNMGKVENVSHFLRKGIIIEI